MDEPRNPIQLDPDDESDLERFESDTPLTREELARELVELLDDLTVGEMRELVDKNVPAGALEFFHRYANDFALGLSIGPDLTGRLPNLMVLGYLLRLLEDRLIENPELA